MIQWQDNLKQKLFLFEILLTNVFKKRLLDSCKLVWQNNLTQKFEILLLTLNLKSQKKILTGLY
jgi:hypothetical protein